MLKKIFFSLILCANYSLAHPIKDLNFNDLFLNASLIVKAIIILLLLLSILSWTIFIAKLIQFYLKNKELTKTIQYIKKQKNIEELILEDAIGKAFIKEIKDEINLSSHQNNLEKRLELRLENIANQFTISSKSYISILANIGALSPFIGLFGTVWGIMNSFIGIAASNNASLSTVAPGIAEALFATAFGLGVAIPAVFFYNFLTKSSLNLTVKIDELANFLFILNNRNSQ